MNVTPATFQSEEISKNFSVNHRGSEYVYFMYYREIKFLFYTTLYINDESNRKLRETIIYRRIKVTSFWVKVKDFEQSFCVGTEIESARFFRRDLALNVGGFDEDVVFFEEATLPHKIEKLGYNVKRRIKSEILHHEEDFSLRKWLKKKYYYGKSAWKYVRRYSQRGNKQVNPMRRFGLFLKNKRFHSKPFLAIGVITLKSLEYELAGFGYLAGRVRRKE